VLTNYSPQAIGSTVTLTITGKIPSTGFLYVNVHLNYGLKKVSNFARDSLNNAVNATSMAPIIPEGASYTFSASALGSNTSQTITSTNKFNKDPGVIGVVTDLNGTPRANILVQLYDQNGNVLAMTFTDQNGVFGFTLQLATGKPLTYSVTVTLSNGTSYTQSVVVRKNHLADAIFQF